MPVGGGLPGVPLSETVTVSAWAFVMVEVEGATVTVGVVSVGCVGVVPPPHAVSKSPNPVANQAPGHLPELLIFTSLRFAILPFPQSVENVADGSNLRKTISSSIAFC